MKILIITQKYDFADSNLGAFMKWWEKMAERADFVSILALEKRSEPPRSNMKVFSMGKENGLGKIGRLFNFYKNLFKILPETDVIFVHMVPLYLILAWLPAKFFGNKLVMWYAGVTMNNWVRLAVWLSDKSVTSQEGALRIKSPKRIIIGHGIDTSLFKTSNVKHQMSNVTILSIGRITPSKGHDLVIKSVADLVKDGYDLRLKIIGGVVQEYHRKYQENLKKLAAALNIADKVEFTGAISYEHMPNYYNEAQILVDAVPSGGFDKVILEAMASGVIPLTSNEYIKPIFPEDLREKLFFREGDLKELKSKLKSVIEKRLWENESLSLKLRNIIVENYDLDTFIDRLFYIFTSFNNLKVLYFGTYNPEYSRNRVLIDGLRYNGVEVIECRDDSLGLKKFWRLFLKFRKIKSGYDAVVIGFFGPLMVTFAKLMTLKPVIFDPLTFLYDTNVMDRKVTKPGTFRAFYYWLLDWLNLRLADMVLLDTEENIKYASKEFKIRTDKFKKLFIGTREDIYHPMGKNSETKKFLVGFHGFFNTLQGVEFIIRAAKKLESYEDIKFIIIGGGKDKIKHFKLAEDLKARNIEFIGLMDQKELALKISQSDICLGIFGVSDKARRVIPNKVYECAAMKKPVISADTPAIRELFTDDDLTLVKIADAEAIASAVLKLKSDKELREKLANNAYEKLISNASAKILGLKFKEMIQELIHRN